MSDNLAIWNQVRVVPEEAQKAIKGGRLIGMTDINPMWRFKALTEQFGVCGVGWKYVTTKQWLETGADGNVSAFVNVDLYIKIDGEWSDAIPGNGGSSFIAKEKAGLYTSDECFKMATTDAISVACKPLGIGADIYWGDKTKYDNPEQLVVKTETKKVEPEKAKQEEPEEEKLLQPSARCQELYTFAAKYKFTVASVITSVRTGWNKRIDELTDLELQSVKNAISKAKK